MNTPESGIPVRILHVEDSAMDALMLRRHLEFAGLSCDLKRVDSRLALEEALKCGPWGILITDYVIPGFGGLQAVQITRAYDPDLPCIILSGMVGEDVAVDALRAGARDFIAKTNMTRLVPAIQRELEDTKQLRAKRLAEQEQARREFQLRQAQKLEAIGQLAAGIAHEINTPTQYIGDNTTFLRDAFRDLMAFLGDLTRFHEDSNPDLPCWKQVQSWMKAVDLNYLQEEIPRAIQQSMEGIARVSAIVSAMKDFSHPDSGQRELIDLNQAIESTILVSSNEWKYVAELETDLDPELPPIPCFPGEFNQVLLNLIVNAAHAITEALAGRIPGQKGLIRVSTRRAGGMVEIRVSDTGTGIPESIRGRIFDPFFTTKPVGKGTGQGLAIAHSVIIDKFGGRIDLESEVGKGTTFVIGLPLTPGGNMQENTP